MLASLFVISFEEEQYDVICLVGCAFFNCVLWLVDQVSNWFINARVRLWKPMIEEMYTEMDKRKVCRNEGTESSHGNRISMSNQRF